MKTIVTNITDPKYWIFAISILLLCACQEDDAILEDDCKQVVVDNDLFASSEGDDFDFEDINLDGNCLVLMIRYGGGCGSIATALIDAGDFEGVPPRRSLRLKLEDNDPCEALITNTTSFDLTEIQLADEDEILLDIAGWPSPIIYLYD